MLDFGPFSLGTASIGNLPMADEQARAVLDARVGVWCPLHRPHRTTDWVWRSEGSAHSLPPNRAGEISQHHQIDPVRESRSGRHPRLQRGLGHRRDVQERGKDNITVVGFESGKAQIDAIKNGVMVGAVTQDPIDMGRQLVKAALKAVNGE